MKTLIKIGTGACIFGVPTFALVGLYFILGIGLGIPALWALVLSGLVLAVLGFCFWAHGENGW